MPSHQCRFTQSQSQITVTGHSHSGAAAIDVLQSRKRFGYTCSFPSMLKSPIWRSSRECAKSSTVSVHLLIARERDLAQLIKIPIQMFGACNGCGQLLVMAALSVDSKKLDSVPFLVGLARFDPGIGLKYPMVTIPGVQKNSFPRKTTSLKQVAIQSCRIQA